MSKTTSTGTTNTGTTSTGWTVGRIATALTGCVVAILGLTLLGVGAIAVPAALDDDPYIHLGESARFRSSGYAVASDPWTPDYLLPGIESIRLRVNPTSDAASDPEIFAGFAATEDAEAYLADVRHTALHAGYTEREQIDGSAPSRLPEQMDIWIARAEGAGARALDLDSADVPRDGVTPIVMNTDRSPGVDAHVEIAYRIPRLPAIAAGMVTAGALLTVSGGWLVIRPIRRARHG